MKIIDNAIAVRIIYLLTLPFDEWPAFKEGIIDKNGKLISDKDDIDSDNWTMLHRLVWRMKIMLAKVPGGQSQISTFAAAYALVRECKEQGISINEEGVTPANNTSGIAPKDNKVILKKRKTFKDHVYKA